MYSFVIIFHFPIIHEIFGLFTCHIYGLHVESSNNDVSELLISISITLTDESLQSQYSILVVQEYVVVMVVIILTCYLSVSSRTGPKARCELTRARRASVSELSDMRLGLYRNGALGVSIRRKLDAVNLFFCFRDVLARDVKLPDI